MQIAKSVLEMKQFRGEMAGSVGLVPTMGFLHAGHLELVRRAKAGNDLAVVSIFVNPTQFGPSDDFASYPRDIPRDLDMLKNAGVDIVFMPPASDMYPPLFSTWLNVEKITERLEGAARPGHFRGVATVCCKLFNIVRPDVAYFGQKDAQQCVVIKKMVADLNMDLEIAVVPTVREPDGLAMSSRNTYLNADERKAAVVLSQSLELAKSLYAGGKRDADTIREAMKVFIGKEPLANIDYVSIADAVTLEELKEIKPPALVSIVVKIGKPRLLDNVILD